MEKKINRVYIIAKEDGEKGIIETLEKWGGKNRFKYGTFNIKKGEYWSINGNISYLGKENDSSMEDILEGYTEIKVGQIPEEKIEANNDETLINALAVVERLTNDLERLQSRYDVLKEMADEFAKERNKLREQVKQQPKKLPMYKGDKERGAEIIKALEDAEGNNRLNCSGETPEFFYYIGESNIIEFTNQKWLAEQLFELKELPPKKIELVEGEFYKCADSPNDVCIFIYKNTNEYDTSFLCGINISGGFTESSDMYFSTIDNILPATQEQKEVLLKRIEQEGYVYNKKNITLERKKEVVEFTLSAENYDRMVCRKFKTTIPQKGRWFVRVFEKYNASVPYFADNTDRVWEEVLPFNEETAKLVGTTDCPDKEYKFIKK